MIDTLRMRRAQRGDIPAIMALLVDDDLGKLRETAEASTYERAFDTIDKDPNQLLAVAVMDRMIAGCFQLTFIPGLSRGGQWRGHIEAVRVVRSLRGQGIGHTMIGWAIEQCRLRGCGLVQLMADKARVDAHRFYQSLGFEVSHEGLRLRL